MYTEITDGEELQGVFALSDEQPVMLFLYDPFCPVNARAMRQVDELSQEVYIVDVAQRHGLGTEIQLATGVRHESPQLIILRNGAPAWHASHGRITAPDVRSALAQAA